MSRNREDGNDQKMGNLTQFLSGKLGEYVGGKHEAEDELYDTFSKDGEYEFADIGACDGLDSIRYCRMFPNMKAVWAVEPRQDNCSSILRNAYTAGLSSKIFPVNCAFSDKAGVMTLHSSYAENGEKGDWQIGNKSSSLLVPRAHLREHAWCKFKTEKVTTSRMDVVFAGKKIDYIHIDVQGAELMVFRGGETVLRNVQAIWIEVSNIYLYAQQALKCDVERFLQARGFECVKDTCGGKKYGDMFWRRK